MLHGSSYKTAPTFSAINIPSPVLPAAAALNSADPANLGANLSSISSFLANPPAAKITFLALIVILPSLPSATTPITSPLSFVISSVAFVSVIISILFFLTKFSILLIKAAPPFLPSISSGK